MRRSSAAPRAPKTGSTGRSIFDGEISPLGPLVAQAQAEGYLAKTRGQDSARSRSTVISQDPHRQGKHRARRQIHYIINGNMIGGFALVAWPASQAKVAS